MTTLTLATAFLCLASWRFARTRPAGGAVAILFAVSFVGFLVAAWCAAPGAIDAF